MRLLDDIIEILGDSKGSLTDALLKTKMLMYQIGHQELVEWVNHEIGGYPDDVPVPDYRNTNTVLMGQIGNAAFIQDKVVLPTSHLPQKLRDYFEKSELRQSINVLEHLASNPDKHLISTMRPEYFHEVEKGLSGYYIRSMWTQLEPSQVMNALIVVRSRLLDFALKLQTELSGIKDADVKEVVSRIDANAMFQHVVMGDNATIVIGDHNHTIIKNSVTKNDFESLAELLKSKGVADQDVETLRSAIELDKDTVDHKNKQFGPSVKQWIKNMLGKAIETSWQIELNVAAGLLTTALQKYYF